MAKRRRVIYLGDASCNALSRWTLVPARLAGVYGECDYDKKTIRIHHTLRGIELLDTLIHELIHARWPDLSEDAVEEFASTLAAIVDEHGFREPDDHED